MGSVAKSYKRKGFLIYEEMRKYSLLNSVIFYENFLFFFINEVFRLG
jgi:hypothetical protein